MPPLKDIVEKCQYPNKGNHKTSKNERPRFCHFGQTIAPLGDQRPEDILIPLHSLDYSVAFQKFLYDQKVNPSFGMTEKLQVRRNIQRRGNTSSRKTV